MSFRDLPKIDLHCHLDGAVRPATLVQLASDAGFPWPPDAEQRCRVPASCRSLADFLATFEFFLPALGSREALRRAARELCRDMRDDGVIYFEARFAPTLWLEKLRPEDAVEGALQGLKEGEAETGVKSGLILCGIRNFPPERTMIAARLAHRYRDEGVAGLDIAGDERSPFAPHREAFAEARRLGVPITIHAGEAGPAANVREALEAGAARIGHGVRAAEDPAVVEEARRRGATFEMCLTSNLMTHCVKAIAEHPFAGFLRDGLKVTLNTDDPGVQGSTLSQDYDRAARDLGLSRADLRAATLHAAGAAFAPEALREELRRRVAAGWD